MKLIGIICLLAGATGIGIAATVQLNYQVTVLRSLKDSLASMERELTFKLMPMTELLRKLGQEASSPSNQFFVRCYEGLDRLGEKTFQEIWCDALDQEESLSLSGDSRQIMMRLGSVLGRYDSEEQRIALRQAQDELGECLRVADGESRRLGRVYTTLGLGSGAMLVILLL